MSGGRIVQLGTLTSAPRGTLLSVHDAGRPISVWRATLALGSRRDPAGKEGLAHLTAQLLTRGAAGRDRQAFAKALDRIGSSLSVHTARDHMTVHGDALSRHLGDFEALVADALQAPRFEDSEILKVQRQLLAELEALRDHDDLLSRRALLGALFADHPYGRRAMGTEASVATLTPDDVRGFWATHAVRAGALVAAAGDASPGRVQEFATAVLSGLPVGDATPWSPGAPARGAGLRVVLVDKPERTQTQIAIGQGLPSAHHEDHLALRVGQTLFGGTFTSRLSHAIREERGWSYGAGASMGADRHLGSFVMTFAPATKDAVPAIQLALDMLGDLASEGPTSEEVEAAKRYLIKARVFHRETAERELQERVGAWLRRHPPTWLETYTSRVAAVTREHVAGALARHLRPADQVVSVLGTASELEPALRALSGAEVSVVSWRDV